MTVRGRSFAWLVLVPLLIGTSCHAFAPVIGGPCEYRSFDGRCRLVGVAFEPRADRDGVMVVRARYVPLGDGPMLTETLERPSAERELVARYYRAFAEVDCRGSVIRSGTCAPETSSFEKPPFEVPGAPTTNDAADAARAPLDCETSPSVATCNAAGYAATFTTSKDPRAATRAYQRAAELEVDECRAGFGRACASLAAKARFGLGMEASSEDADRLLAIACKLHEPRTCFASAARGQVTRDAGAD